jgi:hypothetical protein
LFSRRRLRATSTMIYYTTYPLPTISIASTPNAIVLQVHSIRELNLPAFECLLDLEIPDSQTSAEFLDEVSLAEREQLCSSYLCYARKPRKPSKDISHLESSSSGLFWQQSRRTIPCFQGCDINSSTFKNNTILDSGPSRFSRPLLKYVLNLYPN